MANYANRIDWVPANGLNLEDPAVRIGPDQCSEALNMVFERGVARTRPYAVRRTYVYWPDPSTAKFRFARAMLVTSDNPNSVVILSDGSLGKGPQAQALTQSGGGTLALGNAEFDNITTLNALFVIGNNSGNGMIRHDPTTSNFTIVSNSPFRYFTGLYARAIGGYSTVGNQVGWSVAGDETDWTGAGSGTSILAETTDEITGMRTIQNVVVVIRSMGFTAGFPTGDATNPIRWETVVRTGRQGCPYPSTVADDGNELFWHGQDDVYRMDLNLTPTPIGRQIRRETLYWLARGVLFRGFTTRMDYGPPSGGQSSFESEVVNPVPRLRYHLVPISRPGVPHYTYDFEAKSWSRQTYAYNLLGGYEGFNLATSSATSAVSWNTTLFLDEATRDILRWADGSSGAGEVADEGSYMMSGVFVVGEPEMEYSAQRLFITWARDGFAGSGEPEPPVMTVRLDCKQQQRPMAKEADVNLYESSEGYNDWQGSWVDLRLTGQFFRIKLIFPPQLRIQIAQVTVFFGEGVPTKAGNFVQQ